MGERTARVARGVAKISAAIERGVSGEILASLVKSTFLDKEDAKLAFRQLGPILTEALQEQPKKTAEYEGAKFTASAPQETRKDSRSALAALRWIRRAMSEGFAGKDLDDLIGQRFLRATLEEIEEPLKKIRLAHEGGAGFLYVDASAYATPDGVRGCEEGALKHRANTIPSVTQMKKCSSCSMARVREDGTRKCAVYNKALLENTRGPEMDGARRENIRLANMGDAEQTAALFDPAEFNLKNANLENLNLDAPEHEILNISFGGWDL